MGDWKFLDIVFKEFVLTLLYWFFGVTISSIITIIVFFFLALLFGIRKEELAFCILFLGFMVTAIISSSRLIKHIIAIKETEENYSKEDWTIIERRILGIETYVIANIIIACACLGVSIYELIKLF